MRVDPSNARAQVQTAVPKAAERKPKPESQPPAEQAARPEAAKPSQQAIKNNRIDVRAWTGFSLVAISAIEFSASKDLQAVIAGE